MKKILLVEPAYKSIYPPLGLMKISTWHKNKGDEVQFIKDTPHNPASDQFEKNKICYKILKKHYDIIYITTLFTYQSQFIINSIKYYKERFPKAQIKVGGIMATLMPDYVQKKTGIKPHIGLLRGAENCSPDYSLFPNLEYSITFASRGCRRKCPFCAVHKHEPEFFVKDNWPKDIDITKKGIILWDNNWLMSPNLEKDAERLLEFKKTRIHQIDFNQGLDCRLFNEDIAKLVSQLRINPLRFAFDNGSEDGYIQKAIKLARKYGFKDISVYVLYNFVDECDTPEYFFHRINELNKLGVLAYPMRYRPLNDLNGQFISKNWNKEILRALKLCLMFYYTKGMIRKNRDAFTEIFGKSDKQFKEKMTKIYEYDLELKKKGAKKNQ